MENFEVCIFGTTSMCESSFTAVNLIKSTYRAGISDKSANKLRYAVSGKDKLNFWKSAHTHTHAQI